MTIRVNFHTHSTLSDGELTPEMLAEHLARDGVKFAALTDHDCVDGLARFEQAAHAHGLGVITGVELTVAYPDRVAGEMHLIGYGFDPAHPDLTATLYSLQQNHTEDIHSIVNSVRKGHHAASAAPHGTLAVADAIALLHRAGGRVFLAHPLCFEADFEALDNYLAHLKSLGLDGIEARYAAFTAEQQAHLCALAEKHDLLVSAGTDIHHANRSSATFGCDLPRQDWVKFREAIFSVPNPISASPALQHRPPVIDRMVDQPVEAPRGAFRRRYFIIRIVLPTALAIGIFLAVIWGLILPSFENTLLERKREMIRELTNTAWSILASYEADERAGLLTRAEAQEHAKAQIEALRYGHDSKDYFWLQDMQPRIVMHPYRSDLNGQDVSEFTDPNGVRLFVEFSELVQRQDEGYLDYVWQWQDDPQRLEPKESYVKGFAPWGWIIGTGLYLDDVYAEIDHIESQLVNSVLLISIVMIVLLGFVVQGSLRIERQRRDIETGLRLSTGRYQALVEATTEGTLLVLAGRCCYANPTFLHTTGYNLPQLDFLELEDLLPRDAENALAWEQIEGAGGGSFEGALQHADGRRLDCLLVMNPIQFAGQEGWILLAKELASPTDFAIGVAEMVNAVPVGMFRARATRQGAFIHLNEAARILLPASVDSPALPDLFADTTEFNQFMHQLQAKNEIHEHLLHLETPDAATRFISLSARLARDANGQAIAIDGTLADVTAARKHESERAELIERLQTSLLFLHEPVGRLGRDIVTCDLQTPIADLARQMTVRNATAALVVSDSTGVTLGLAIGIVTDHDLRARVLASDIALTAPVCTIMSAPITRISEQALIYEALMRMEEKGVQHLAVEDENGQIVSLVDNKSLIQFQHYGAIVLTRQIARAPRVADVAHHCRQAPPLIKALVDSGARPRQAMRVLAGVCDAASTRLIELAIEEFGPPPAAFAFVAMGSQGRQEQTLLTDQDNGILFDPLPDADASQIAAYFLRLGERVSSGLAQAGYAPCRGGVMASQPRWCRSLTEWKAGFDEWVRKSEPQELIDFSIFFDFRTVYGDADLALELRRYIHNKLQDTPGFFPFFARNALTFKPPFRLLGNIYLSGGSTEHAGQINLKDASMPIVSFARLYALRHHVNQTHTLERLEALAERGVISLASRDEIITAYDLLMRLRLHNQLASIAQSLPPDNLIQPTKLGYIEQELIKQAFAQIAAVQKKVGYDFFGGET